MSELTAEEENLDKANFNVRGESFAGYRCWLTYYYGEEEENLTEELYFLPDASNSLFSYFYNSKLGNIELYNNRNIVRILLYSLINSPSLLNNGNLCPSCKSDKIEIKVVPEKNQKEYLCTTCLVSWLDFDD